MYNKMATTNDIIITGYTENDYTKDTVGPYTVYSFSHVPGGGSVQPIIDLDVEFLIVAGGGGGGTGDGEHSISEGGGGGGGGLALSTTSEVEAEVAEVAYYILICI